MLDVHTSEPHDYTEIAPPLLVRDEAMFGTAQLPKFAEDQFCYDIVEVAPEEFTQRVKERREDDSTSDYVRMREFALNYKGQMQRRCVDGDSQYGNYMLSR